ncbi:MAG: DNA polymerase Y family protein [Candidatus Zixiibacteriota bacterium]|nr:MAG: DNA polymerase Y family protein [candidate division Zixibacteria bacterium]
MTGERMACLTIPNFRVVLCLHDEPFLQDKPLVLTADDSDLAPIVAINEKAASAGLTLDITATQAATLCSDLAIRVNDTVKEIEASNAVFKKLQSLSPFVEETDPGRFFLDAAGLTLLYKDERTFAEKMIRLVQTFGYPARAGIAGNKFVAAVAAEISDDNAYAIVPTGHEGAFLKDLPIRHIPLSPETEETLHDLGLKTIGQLAAFPANEMIRRFGPEGTALSQLARGESDTYFLPESPGEELTDSVHLTFPIHNTAAILTYIEQLLSPLLAKPKRFNQGCRRIKVTLTLENKKEQSLPVYVEQPTLDTAIFLRQFSLDLDKLKLSRGVTSLKVTIPQTERLLTEQLIMSPADGMAVSEKKSFENINDHSSVYTPRLHPAILPEQRFSLMPLSDRRRNKQPIIECFHPSPLYSLGNISGLRLFQPPCRVTVVIAEHRPVELIIDGPTGAESCCITSWHGPWQLSGEWWASSFDRLYYEVRGYQVSRLQDKQPRRNRRGFDLQNHLQKHPFIFSNRHAERSRSITTVQQGCRYLLFYDRSNSNWFLQGVFD